MFRDLGSLPIHTVFLLPCIHYYSILVITSSHCCLVLCHSLLWCPSRFTYIRWITISAWNLIHNACSFSSGVPVFTFISMTRSVLCDKQLSLLLFCILPESLLRHPWHTVSTISLASLSSPLHSHCPLCLSVLVMMLCGKHGSGGEILMKVKMSTPEEKRTGIVYQIPCRDCDSTYIGETGRTSKKRMVQHKAAVRGRDDKNGIAVHACKQEHCVD